jgi:hypothetical protein
MPSADLQTLKRWSLAMVSEVEPDDTFVITDDFDSLLSHWATAKPEDEGRFIGGPEMATFAALIGPFLAGLFADVAKDVVKDQAKKRVAQLLEKFLGHSEDADERKRLRQELDAAVNKSRFSQSQKVALRKGFEKLFKQTKRPQAP